MLLEAARAIDALPGKLEEAAELGIGEPERELGADGKLEDHETVEVGLFNAEVYRCRHISLAR